MTSLVEDQSVQPAVNLTVELSPEVVKGIDKIARLRRSSRENLLVDWILDGLERDELRFERLLLFANICEDLDQETCRLLAKLRQKYFDDLADGERGLDAYIVKCTIKHHLYQCAKK